MTDGGDGQSNANSAKHLSARQARCSRSEEEERKEKVTMMLYLDQLYFTDNFTLFSDSCLHTVVMDYSVALLVVTFLRES